MPRLAVAPSVPSCFGVRHNRRMTHPGRVSRGETEGSDEIAYEIRDATVADAFDLALLGARAYAFRDGRPSPEMPSAGALSALASCLSRPGDWCLMHRKGAELILAEVSGFPLDYDEQPTAASARHYISSLSVLPSHWGEGHGSRILRAAVARRSSRRRGRFRGLGRDDQHPREGRVRRGWFRRQWSHERVRTDDVRGVRHPCP